MGLNCVRNEIIYMTVVNFSFKFLYLTEILLGTSDKCSISKYGSLLSLPHAKVRKRSNLGFKN